MNIIIEFLRAYIEPLKNTVHTWYYNKFGLRFLIFNFFIHKTARLKLEESGWCKNVAWSSKDCMYSGSFYKGLLWKWRTDGTNKLTFYVDCKGIVLTRACCWGEWSAAWHHSRRRRRRGDTRRTMFSVVAESRLFSFHPGNPPPATQFLIACCLLCWTGFNWFIGQTNFNVGQTHGRIRYGQPRSQQSQWTPAGNCTKQARMWSQSTF